MTEMMGTQVVVKQWIAKKNLSQEQYSAVSGEGFCGDVVKETEKAVNVRFSTKYGTVWSWFPKSQVSEYVDYNELDDETQDKMQEEFDKALEKGLEYNQYLRQLAYDNRLVNSIKRRYSTTTLIEKLTNASIEFTTKSVFFGY